MRGTIVHICSDFKVCKECISTTPCCNCRVVGRAGTEMTHMQAMAVEEEYLSGQWKSHWPGWSLTHATFLCKHP